MERSQKIIKFISIAGMVTIVFLFILGYRIGIFKTSEVFYRFLDSLGFYGPLIFIIVQIIQVIIPIVPGGFTLGVGFIAFGPIYGFIYNYASIVLGSIINFLLAKRYGKKLVMALASKKTYDKYVGWIDSGKKFERFFTMAMISPIAPDDILCYLAGLTKMKFKTFTLIVLLSKPGNILFYSAGLSMIFKGISQLFNL